MNDGADVKALQQLRREAPRTINNVVTNCWGKTLTNVIWNIE
jgi:hypothetical protein